MKYFSHFAFVFGFWGLVACGSSGATQHSEAASHSPNEHTHAEAQPTNSSNATSESNRPGLEVSPEERAAYEKARPLLETYCAKCHTTRGDKATAKALEHFKMDAYPFGGHHAAEITATIRDVLGVTGSKPTMPRDKPGAVKGEDLRVILAWADAYDRAHASPATEPHKHDHGGHEH